MSENRFGWKLENVPLRRDDGMVHGRCARCKGPEVFAIPDWAISIMNDVFERWWESIEPLCRPCMEQFTQECLAR